MAKGKLGPKGWEVPTRAKGTRGTLEEVNAANNALVLSNNSLREENDKLLDENIKLQAQLDEFDAADKSAAILAILEGLDHEVDALWTAEGQVRVDVVCDALEDEDITREMIEEVYPGFNRDVAKNGSTGETPDTLGDPAQGDEGGGE